MSRMFPGLDLLVLMCLLRPVISETGHILRPQNFTLRWINDFEPELSWKPQDSVRNCTYKVEKKTQTGEPGRTTVNTSMWSEFTVLGGRYLNFSVTTHCDNSNTELAVYNITYPELVKNLVCHYYAPEKTRCQWNQTSDAPDLGFFYQLTDESTNSNNISSNFQECLSYIRNAKGVKTGCELLANNDYSLYISFKGTVNNTTARNTFKIQLKDHVRPPALKWTVVKSKDAFNISWSAPDILGPECWNYKIRYTDCNKTEKQNINKLKKKRSYSLVRDSRCQYRIAIKAEVEIECGNGATPWSADEYFDIDRDLDALVSVAFIIPCVLAVLVALMFVCCRSNKEKFCPRIITPVDLITDIDNNNKSNLYNLPAPAEEEQTCEITVLDPEAIRLDC
ncbi:uncharacterized protein LOC110950435 [Acanthochromis polyacanthus]|uniref:uncharacterized protein LOC110950435 n=1 Tax=Acanthochromis polyacanthus TaxID=80966 RepID=UPI0022347AF0|nr:uncharacterized protein LOC110950435 [Acanthochromis polyacanthus]